MDLEFILRTKYCTEPMYGTRYRVPYPVLVILG